ncbi:FliM/FliN family flagellar motor C-terminal domain-containing protein [Pseudomonas sp. QL9]|uniref:Surface presentation of antigens (SpoA) protein n=1 Tax=Pseudomonas knackmussii (strain DSM 6978 / CCUG 54928 / LMG 23759 / B13) TaxID=1301098 RepID=A0A024HGT0_PSEKB|nr:FliM/FliN family flagellar motor C-terminal domain-containing protein [Pseudomonas knackmussii]CDF83859.1 surface presentation of antigens (SpoA) protein [Pseudomonas knackmussii B13]
MTGPSKVHHGVPSERLTRLQPHKLGRHHHRVPQYIREIVHKYPRTISDYFLRNYRINLELQKIEVHEQAPRPAECVFSCPGGKVGFAIDRPLLTEALECYYGGTSLPSHDTPPISTSEQRMRKRLGVDVSQLFARSLLLGDTFGELSPHDNDYEIVQWEYVAEFQFLSHITGNTAALHIYLDGELTDELTARLSGPPPARLNGDPMQHLLHLPVRLDCVIAALQLPLNQALDLRPGDIIPVRMLERCDVQVNQQKLFRGSLFEEDGGLFLTSLESVTSP